MLKRLISLMFCLSLSLAAPIAVHAATPLAEASDSHSTMRVYAERNGLKPSSSQWLAVEIEPREGWHSYWQNPGDSGAAPILDWQLPAGVTAGKPLFSVPEIIPVGPLANYGYHGASVMLVKLETGAQIEDKPLILEAEWLICEVECVPQFATLTLDRTQGSGDKVTENTELFVKTRAKLPEPSYWSSSLEVDDEASILTVFMTQGDVEGIESTHYFSGQDGVVAYAAPQSWKWADDGLKLSMPREEGTATPSNASGILVLNLAGDRRVGFEIEPKLTTMATAPDSQTVILPDAASMPLWQAALFALFGGLILNLMPCVFPVLSLKAFAFLSANYKTEANRRLEGVAYTLGIWVSFMVIVGVLVALRAGGAAIGWGFQLQEPLFVALMMVLMTFVALSLSGFFNISFGAESAGQTLAAREGIQGAFFKGVLAALVATPCTAPLMAPAIGFALTQPLITVFVVFSLLAIGLALPFLALSFIPAFARLMPKPGAWMEKMKEALAFPLYLTAAWLLYIFDRQVGAVATLLLLAGLITSIFGIWLSKQGEGKVLRAFAILFVLGGVAFIASKPWGDLTEQAAEVAEDSQPYSDQRVAELVDEGKPVFAYFTADWCITCKVNERVVLATDEVQAAFKGGGITVLKGDWTNRNAEIAAVLARYGRAGVPLYLYFPAGSGEAVVLPELLTKGAVFSAINGSE
ncbi:protein-disulfide reductase DsbD family protein [Kordiimonas gwangyangensis]|uniref:protein-disulfide reductase DsbD family protein n=1 Tax=Kordiimonas gwangyangensis TaxID=288022 RepID=UPI0004782E32|nr:thioredoxin family protein [Kordiimonas gwangyangensis]